MTSTSANIIKIVALDAPVKIHLVPDKPGFEIEIAEVCDAVSAVIDGPPEDMKGIPVPAELLDFD